MSPAIHRANALMESYQNTLWKTWSILLPPKPRKWRQWRVQALALCLIANMLIFVYVTPVFRSPRISALQKENKTAHPRFLHLNRSRDHMPSSGYLEGLDPDHDDLFHNASSGVFNGSLRSLAPRLLKEPLENRENEDSGQLLTRLEETRTTEILGLSAKRNPILLNLNESEVPDEVISRSTGSFQPNLTKITGPLIWDSVHGRDGKRKVGVMHGGWHFNMQSKHHDNETLDSQNDKYNNLLFHPHDRPAGDHTKHLIGYPEDAHFILQPQKACRNDTFLLIVVCSALQNFHLRDAIRETWGGVNHRYLSRTQVLFMVGKPAPHLEHFQSVLQGESEWFRDVIQTSVIDDYRNLTLKSVELLRWCSESCQSAQFIMKTDDDVFISVPNVIQTLHERLHSGQRRFILGHVIKNAKPILDRSSKWYTPVSHMKMYPTYVSGTGYVISRDLIPDLYRLTSSAEYLWLEDIYVTGILGAKSGAVLIHDDRFGYEKRKMSPCLYRRIIVGHDLSPGELVTVWTQMQTVDCSREDWHFDKNLPTL